MSADRTPNPAVLATRLASLTAILAIIVGIMVLVGWVFDIAVLKSVWPGWVAMKANTAVCFILIGIALWLTARPHATFNPRISTFLARICGLLAGLVGLLTLCEYIFNWNPGLDQWLFYEPPGAIGTSYPGRMAPETALCFVLLAAALWIVGSSRQTRQTIRRARWTILASVSIGLLVVALALAAGLSYPMADLGTYGWFGLTIMAMHTAVLFALLGMAVIAISWKPDVLQWSLGGNTTTAFACGMAVLVLIGFNINRSQFWLGETNRKIAYSEELQDYIENVLIEIVDAQAHTRGYVITGDEQFKANYLEAKTNSIVNLDALRKSIADKPHEQQLFAQIETQTKAQLQWFQQVIDARQTRMADATRSDMIRHGEGMLDNFRITYAQLKSEHQQRIDDLKQESKRVVRLSYIIIATGTLASLLIFLTIIFRLNFAVNERKQKEGALQESEERFRKITESAQDAIIIMGSDQKISFWNAAAERVFGYNAAEAIGRELHALIVPTPAYAKFSQAFPHFQETGDGPIIGKVRELIALRKSGDEFPAELSVSAAQFGGQWYAIGIVRDITERKRAEESLRKLSLAVEQSPNAIVIADLDANIEYVNAAFVKITGYSLAEVIGQNPRILQSGKTPKATYDDLWAHLIRGEAWSGEIINRRKDGSEYVESMLISPVRQADGCVTNYLAIKEDITERKRIESDLGVHRTELEMQNEALRQAQIALEESRDQFVDLYDFSPVGYLTLNHESMIDKINLTATALFGAERNKLLYHRFASLVATEDRDRWHRHFIDVLQHDGKQRCELALRRSDGSVFHAQLDCLHIKTGGASSVRVTITDITERKQAEAKLIESEERFRLIVETMDEIFWLADVSIEKMHYISPGYERIWGRTTRSLYDNPRSFIEAIYPEDRERVLLDLEAQKAGQPFSHEYRIVRPDGAIRWVWDRGFPIRDKAGKVTHYAGVAQDITERKQVDAELLSMANTLRESRQLLDSIVEHIPVMVFVKRASDLCFEMFNRAGEKLLGYSRSDLLGKGNYDFWPKEQGDWFTAADRKVLASHEITEIQEEQINTASGEVRYLHTWKVALRDENGEPAHLLGISVDITERKLAEAKFAEQLDELNRWHSVTSGREKRILELKHEINELLAQAGQPPRYPSAE